jgi:hypothetical protein
MAKILTVSEVARSLGVSRSTVWRWIRDGRFGDVTRLGFGATSPYVIRFVDFARVAAELSRPARWEALEQE